MFDILSSVSSNVAVSAASKVLNILFEDLRDRSGPKALRNVEIRDYMERLKSDEVATRLYEEAIQSRRRTKSTQLSEHEVQELTKELSDVIQTRLKKEGKVDKNRGRKLLKDLRNTIP